MTDTTGEQDILDAAERIERQVSPLMDMLRQRTHASNANINVNAGGVGLQMAIMACVVQFILFVALLLGGVYVIDEQNKQITDMQRKLDRTQDYLNTIYQDVPQLKPKDAK